MIKDRRHKIRKILLAIDYIVEFIGSVFGGFVAFGFVGDRILLQHIFLTIGSIIYGVAIPLSHLLNETRVREVILKEGWTQGFKSIFYSSKKIKQIKRKKILNSVHSKCFPLPSDNFSGPSIPFTQSANDSNLLRKQSCIECIPHETEDLIQPTHLTQNISKKIALKNLGDGSANLSSHEGCTRENNVVNLNPMEHCMIGPNFNKDNEEINGSRASTNNSTGQSEWLFVHHLHDTEDTTNIDKLTSPAQSNTAMCDTVGTLNVQGFKSIHYSCKKIKQSEMRRKISKKTKTIC